MQGGSAMTVGRRVDQVEENSLWLEPGDYGKDTDGEQHCCGMIRIPFSPPLPGFAVVSDAVRYWQRTSGDTVDDLTLEQSVNADKCGHFNITNGNVIVHPS